MGIYSVGIIWALIIFPYSLLRTGKFWVAYSKD